MIDFENINSPRDVSTVLEMSESRGSIVAKKAFGDWTGPIENSQVALTELGVDTIHQRSIGRGKNGCDMRLIIEAMDLLHDQRRRIDVFVLATCDVDFVPLVVRLRSAGKIVIVAGRPDVTSDFFKVSADEFVPLTRHNRTHASGQPTPERTRANVACLEPSGALQPSDLKPTPIVSVSETDLPSLDANSKLLVIRAIFDVYERFDGLVKGAPLHASMKALDPAFDFRKLGYDNFADMLASHEMIEVHGRGAQDDITVTIKADTTASGVTP